MKEERSFEPISRETVSSQIRAQLLRRIRIGDLAPGSSMPSERGLSEQFQVGRTSVREAMQGLLSLGVIEHRGNRAYVVEHLPDVVVNANEDRKTFVVELFETRRVLEVPIFTLATERAAESARQEVAALADRFGDVLGLAAFRQLDREFHTTIAASCGNPFLVELYGKVIDQLFRSREFDELLNDETNRAGVKRIVERASVAHEEIAAAFSAGDAEAMGKAAKAHLDSVEESMLDDLV